MMDEVPLMLEGSGAFIANHALSRDLEVLYRCPSVAVLGEPVFKKMVSLLDWSAAFIASTGQQELFPRPVLDRMDGGKVSWHVLCFESDCMTAYITNRHMRF